MELKESRAREGDSAGAAITGTIRRLAAALADSEGPLRRDEPDSVHQTRILVRRLRSVLREYPGVLDPKPCRRMRRRLKAWGDELGIARDAEVRLALAHDAISAPPGHSDPSDPGAEPDGGRLLDQAQQAYREGHDALLRALSSAGHAELMGDLDRFCHAPPLGPLASGPARATFAGMLQESAAALIAAAPSPRRAARLGRGIGVDLAALHEVRKHARRVRYAAEGARDAESGWPRFDRLGATAKQVQDILGEHRDASLFAAHLEGLARAGDPEAAAVLRALARKSRAEASTAVTHLPAAVRRLARAAGAISSRPRPHDGTTWRAARARPTPG